MRDIIPDARQFIKNIKLAMAGSKVSEPRLGLYNMIKHFGLSEQQLGDTPEEDYLAMAWIMRIELKSKPVK